MGGAGSEGARQPRERVEHDHDVGTELDQALRALHDEFSRRDVMVGMLVERRRHDLAVDAARQRCGVFRPAVDRQHDEVRVGCVGEDSARDRDERRGGVDARRHRDQRPLPFTERDEEIEGARGGIAFDAELPARRRRHRVEVFKGTARADRFRIVAVHGLDLDDAVVLLVVFRPAHLARHEIAAAQFEAPDLRLADVDVVGAEQIALAPQEPVTLGQDVEHAVGGLDPGTLRLRFNNLRDQVVLLDLHRGRDVEGLGQLVELGFAHLAELLGGELRRTDRLRKFRLGEDVGLRGRAVARTVAMPPRTAATAATFGPAILRGSIIVLQRSRSLAEGCVRVAYGSTGEATGIHHDAERRWEHADVDGVLGPATQGL